MKKLILFCCVLFGVNAISQAQTTKCGVYQLINTKESKNVLKDHNWSFCSINGESPRYKG